MDRTRLRNALTTAVFIIVLAFFAVFSRLIKPPAVLPGERRPPNKIPALTLDSVAKTDFMRKFEEYAADTVAWRYELRKLRSRFIFYVYRQTDKDGLYLDPAVGAGKIITVNEAECRKTAAKLRTAAEQFLQDTHIYCAVIPDKTDYAARYYPGVSKGGAAGILAEELTGFTHIDLLEALTADSYYRTDLHWEQTSLSSVLSALGSVISGEPWVLPEIEVLSAGGFTGVYPGQLALPMKPDDLKYFDIVLETRYLNEFTLKYENGSIYDENALQSVDPYSFFLKGSQPVIVIKGDTESEKTLYMFRDSFSSSLAPLIAATGQYGEVVLIDLRYIDTRVLGEYVDFKGDSDVLFIYGTQILNDSSLFKVN